MPGQSSAVPTSWAVGGRVLNVTALGKDVAQAQARAYEAVTKINGTARFIVQNIGWRALKR
jgi:phosphoribosylamine--glycine ligase